MGVKSWGLLIGHHQEVHVSWLGLRPRVEVRTHDGVRIVYRPKVSGHAVLGPLTADGRVLSFGRGA